MKKFPNDKPWISGDLREKVKKKEEAHRSGDCVLYKKAKYEVHQAVRGAKVKYRCKLESQILSNNSHAVWQGLQTITGFKKKNADRPNASPSLPDELNHFYSRFDKLNTTPVTAQPPDVSMPLPPPFVVEEGGVGFGKLLLRQTTKKAAGPDNVSTSVWGERGIKLCTKLAVYKAVVITPLLYGCETWTLYRKQLRTLDQFHLWCLWKIMGVSWEDRVSNTSATRSQHAWH